MVYLNCLPIRNGDFPWQTVSHNQRVPFGYGSTMLIMAMAAFFQLQKSWDDRSQDESSSNLPKHNQRFPKCRDKKSISIVIHPG